ncbi:hypothetical protein GCM10027445_20030 [Amycolatopsis endophytica]|uniref:Secreted protein n=1 Tax=Amycolatopsis endophytica TaxID=860233 RepID=A0A853BEC2_9PSEU|nr:hypothetical protein [Amycolatopsis endophytica]NYI93104.1 hypothetical protein [Amycolatopsis endophytica]
MRLRLAAGLAAAALLAAATPAWAGEPSPVDVLGACAELTGTGPGWALLRNDCGAAIDASVVLTGGERAACVPIAAHGTATLTWESEERAEYAVDCL